MGCGCVAMVILLKMLKPWRLNSNFAKVAMQSCDLGESKPDALLILLGESWKFLKMAQVMQWDVQGFVWSHSVECVPLSEVKYERVYEISSWSAHSSISKAVALSKEPQLRPWK